MATRPQDTSASPRYFLFNDGAARFLFIFGTLGILFEGSSLFGSYLGTRAKELESVSIYHDNVLGAEEPETYVLKDGVKYFSKIDGRDITDILNE